MVSTFADAQETLLGAPGGEIPPGDSSGAAMVAAFSELGRPPLNPKTRERIQEAPRAPGRPGVRKIAAQFGVNAPTVQQISSGL